jgi:hypothetical protein
LILLTDIYKATDLLLKSKYGASMKYYGNDTVEGYTKPCFFISIIPVINSNDSINFKTKAFTIMITYHQSIINEIDNLQKADEIINLIGYFLNVNGRKICVTNSDYEFIGENNNVLQISFNIEYIEANTREDSSTIAQTLNINEEMR